MVSIRKCASRAPGEHSHYQSPNVIIVSWINTDSQVKHSIRVDNYYICQYHIIHHLQLYPRWNSITCLVLLFTVEPTKYQTSNLNNAVLQSGYKIIDRINYEPLGFVVHNQRERFYSVVSCKPVRYSIVYCHNFLVTLVATSMGLLVALLIVHSMKPSINDSSITYM